MRTVPVQSYILLALVVFLGIFSRIPEYSSATEITVEVDSSLQSNAIASSDVARKIYAPTLAQRYSPASNFFGSELEVDAQALQRASAHSQATVHTAAHSKEGVHTNVKVYTGADAVATQQAEMMSTLATLGTVAISADADASVELILQEPEVKAALAAKSPDAVDKLIQGILDGTGQGGVVTSEFNQNGVHATIISNVNELRITQLDALQEESIKKTAEQRRKQAIYARDKQQ